MPTVRQHVTDALLEIGVLGPGQSLSPALAAVGLSRFQNQLDSWQADRLSLAVQARTTFTLTSGTSSVTLGPSGATVTITPTPMWLDTVNYINPGSDPEQEIQIGIMDRDTYAGLTIKELSSALPMQCFYQRSNATGLGTLFFWPQVSQNVDIAIYSPQGVGVPVDLDSIVIGPTGYAEAFLYNLALRLCAPTGTQIPEALPTMARDAMTTMRRPNVIPAVLGVDPATTMTTSCGYNVYSDTTQTSR